MSAHSITSDSSRPVSSSDFSERLRPSWYLFYTNVLFIYRDILTLYTLYTLYFTLLYILLLSLVHHIFPDHNVSGSNVSDARIIGIHLRSLWQCQNGCISKQACAIAF